MTPEQVVSILDAAWEVGVRAFDTAQAYGLAPERLAAWLQRRGRLPESHVVTKVKVLGNAKLADDAAVAVAPFRGAASLLLLSHGFLAAEAWLHFAEVCASLDVSVGQSVYTADEVRECLGLARIARVQAPANVFEVAILDARGRAILPLDVRSVFLQGLLLETPENADRRVPGSAPLAAAVAEAAAAVGRLPESMLVAAIVQQIRQDDRIVVGVDTPEHVGLIAAADTIEAGLVLEFRSRLASLVPQPVSEAILDPRRW